MFEEEDEILRVLDEDVPPNIVDINNNNNQLLGEAQPQVNRVNRPKRKQRNENKWDRNVQKKARREGKLFRNSTV